MQQFGFALACLACAMISVVPAAAQAEPAKPTPTGAPHVCSDNYPATAVAANAEGTTLLEFTVTANGTVANVKVAKTSGNAELDAAAVQCASAWRYDPVLQRGKPVEVAWKANVQWALHPAANETFPTPLLAHVCRNYPHGAVWDDAQGSAIVKFHITADGAVKDPTIAKSTGNSDLDQAALACASAWRYKPGTRDGVAVDWPWEANVTWMITSAENPPPSPCGRYAKVTADMLSGIRGETDVSFRILRDGSVTEAGTVRSSGNDALDQAALTCITAMRFEVRAVMPDKGIVQRVSIDWRADLPKKAPEAPPKKVDPAKIWATPDVPAGTTPPVLSQLSFCPRVLDPAVPNPAATQMSLTIGTDGAVKNISVAKSSGSAMLDRAATSCVAGWKYTPASKDGHPVEIGWAEHIEWLRH
jgi:TonB family protein